MTGPFANKKRMAGGGSAVSQHQASANGPTFGHSLPQTAHFPVAGAWKTWLVSNLLTVSFREVGK
jgi:hypothetical protein